MSELLPEEEEEEVEEEETMTMTEQLEEEAAKYHREENSLPLIASEELKIPFKDELVTEKIQQLQNAFTLLSVQVPSSRGNLGTIRVDS